MQPARRASLAALRAPAEADDGAPAVAAADSAATEDDDGAPPAAAAAAAADDKDGAAADAPSSAAPSFAVGDKVDVLDRIQKGSNKPGGRARAVVVRGGGRAADVPCYDVRYVLDGRRKRAVPEWGELDGEKQPIVARARYNTEPALPAPSQPRLRRASRPQRAALHGPSS